MCSDVCVCVVVVFRMRRRARVAPPIDEAEDEGSFQDEFLPPEPPVGRKVEVELEVDPKV